jgi:hypothetical protein
MNSTTKNKHDARVDPTIGPKTCAVPCSMCPFNSKFDGDDGDRPFLRPGRRYEILTGMVHGRANDFICHKTGEVTEDEDGTSAYTSTADSLACAGARLVAVRAGLDSENMKIEERLGMFDREAFLARNVNSDVWTYAAIVAERQDDEEVETCSVVNENCTAPAGYIGDDGLTAGTEAADSECAMCGEAVCSECMDGEDMCPNCKEQEL